MKRVALVVSLAIMAVPAVASAQIGFGVAAGAAFPMGDFGKSWNSGYHVQASVNISPPVLPIGFRIDGTLDNFAVKASTNATGSARIAGVGGNVLLGLGGVPLLGPYVLAGVGFYNINASATAGSFSASGSTNKPGMNVGAGFRFGLGSMGVFAEAGYHYISGDVGSTQFVPVMFGISF